MPALFNSCIVFHHIDISEYISLAPYSEISWLFLIFAITNNIKTNAFLHLSLQICASIPMGQTSVSGTVGYQLMCILNFDTYCHIVFQEKYISVHLETMAPEYGRIPCSAGPCCVTHWLPLWHLIIGLSLTTFLSLQVPRWESCCRPGPRVATRMDMHI